MDPKTCEIKLIGPFNYKEKSEYNMQLKVVSSNPTRRRRTTIATEATAEVSITLHPDLCKDICPYEEHNEDWNFYHSCEVPEGETRESTIWFCAEIMGQPQYRILSGSTTNNSMVTFDIFVPKELELSKIEFVGGNGEADFDPKKANK